MLAAASGNLDAVNALLDRGADVNAKESVREPTPAMFAAASNRAAVLAAARASAAPTSRRPSKVHRPRGARAQDPAALREFTRRQPGSRPASRRPAGAERPRAGAPVARRGRGPQTRRRRSQLPAERARRARRAASRRCSSPRARATCDAVKALLDAGADVNQVSAGDKTSPLLIATINGHFDLAKLLLEQGADPNARRRQRRDAALRARSTSSGRRSRSIRSRARTCNRRRPISS